MIKCIECNFFEGYIDRGQGKVSLVCGNSDSIKYGDDFLVERRGICEAGCVFGANELEVDMSKISESIFSGDGIVIPMADVQHIEKSFHDSNLIKHNGELGARKGDLMGCLVITKHTTWNFEHDVWENAIWLKPDLTIRFLDAWCYYRSELEGIYNQKEVPNDR